MLEAPTPPNPKGYEPWLLEVVDETWPSGLDFRQATRSDALLWFELQLGIRRGSLHEQFDEYPRDREHETAAIVVDLQGHMIHGIRYGREYTTGDARTMILEFYADWTVADLHEELEMLDADAAVVGGTTVGGLADQLREVVTHIVGTKAEKLIRAWASKGYWGRAEQVRMAEKAEEARRRLHPTLNEEAADLEAERIRDQAMKDKVAQRRLDLHHNRQADYVPPAEPNLNWKAPTNSSGRPIPPPPKAHEAA